MLLKLLSLQKISPVSLILQHFQIKVIMHHCIIYYCIKVQFCNVMKLSCCLFFNPRNFWFLIFNSPYFNFFFFLTSFEAPDSGWWNFRFPCFDWKLKPRFFNNQEADACRCVKAQPQGTKWMEMVEKRTEVDFLLALRALWHVAAVPGGIREELFSAGVVWRWRVSTAAAPPDHTSVCRCARPPAFIAPRK